MFTIYFTNQRYTSEREFATLAEAVDWAKSTTFDFQVYKGDQMVGYGSYFGGFRRY